MSFLRIESLDKLDLRPLGRPVFLTVGTFDGVHLGHQALIASVQEQARQSDGVAAVFTFQNHPREVVSPGSCPPALTPWPEKARLLEALGVDVLIGLPFTEEFSRTSATAFMEEILLRRCAAAMIASGDNFRFGHHGEGDANLLRAAAAKDRFQFFEAAPVLQKDGHWISSTRIRAALAEGNVEGAAEMLGRPHRVVGSVASGDGLGRTIGFPTANLQFADNYALPADGVYAVRVEHRGKTWPAMMNIGWRPTVGGRTHRVEVHLLGFDGDLVGETLAVAFIARLRDEQRFPGLDVLKAQLARDRENALARLAPGGGNDSA